MKKLLLIILVILVAGKPETKAQQDIDLNGEWEFNIPGSAPVKVTVPHTYNVMEGLEDYAGVALYRKILPLTEDMKEKKLRICFRGVYHDAVVRVNGREAGRHMGAGYTPFSFDLTPYLNFDELHNNVLEVECDNSYSETNIPWKRHFDWANDGGIYRPVYLHVSGRKSIRYLHITPEINLQDSTAVAHLALRLQEDKGLVEFRLKIKENESGRCVHDGEYRLRSGTDHIFRASVQCGKVGLWHFDAPVLYSYEIYLYDGKEVSDYRRENFGFRTVEIRGDKLLLNGEAVRLPGIEDMPGSNPEKGLAESPEDISSACSMMKAAGSTITRYHWAQDEYRLHLMDSLGMMVQEEISWWQGPSDSLGEDLMRTAKQQMEEMIEAHYNHPCIWAWGLSNEVGDNRKDLQEMKRYAQGLDSTRYYLSMSNHIWSKLEDDPPLSLDLPTWNEYTGTWHAESREQLAGLFDKVEGVLNGRPVLITEAGLCEPAFAGGDSRRIDDMLFHMAEWTRHPYVCGYIYFCLSDYRTQMGEEGIGRHRIRRHGVCDKYLNPKPSYHVLRQLMSPVEITGVKPGGSVRVERSLANQYELGGEVKDALVSIRVKQGIPSYTIRGYQIIYEDDSGADRVLGIPDMSPGEDKDFILKDINHSFNFRITRKDGSPVIEY